MANVPINNLPIAVSLTGTESIPAIQGDVAVRITPDQIAGLVTATGTVTQINTSGPISGGPITTSGTISLQSGGVSNSYLANMANGTIKGNNSGSTGAPQDLTGPQVLALIAAAPLNSPNFTGTPTAPTPLSSDNSTTLATTAFVKAQGYGSGSVTSITAGSGLSGGTITTSGTIALTTTGAIAGSYGSANQAPAIAVDAYGRITSVSNVTITPADIGAVPITRAINTSGLVQGGGTLSSDLTISLANITSGYVVGNSGASAAPPTGTSLASIIDRAIGTTQGQMLYRNATTWTVLNPGTVGQVLQTGGAGANPSWQTITGTGTVTSINVSGGTTGFTFTGGPVTTAGTITMAGTLGTANGGTNLTSFSANGAVYATSSSVLTTGTLPVTGGGTGGTTFTQYGVVYGNAGASLQVTAAGTTGQVLVGNTGSAPTWSTFSSIGVTSISFGTTGLTPSTATTGAITVAGTLGYANGGTGLSSIPANGQIDIGNGSGFTRTTLTAGTAIGITNASGSITINNTGVTSFSAGTTGLTPNTTTTGAVTLGGTLGTGNGGTGLTTFTAANNAIYSTSASALTAGTLPVAAGGTGATTLTGYVKGNGTSAFTASSTIPNTDITGLGTMSTQNANSVAITGGTATLTSVSLTSGTISTTPSGATDIANKSYVDSVAQGLNVKAACLWGTTANITLSGLGTQAGGEWTGSLTAGDRILVKNQTTQADNGIYAASSTGWTRTADADAWSELVSAFVFVEQGATLADTGWVCTVDPGGTLGVTAVTWSQFSGAGTYTAGTGLTLTGTQFSLTSPVATNLGGTGITGFTAANNAIYSTSASALTAGTLPIAAGGTGITSFGTGVQTALGQNVTGSGGIVLATSPTITTPTTSGNVTATGTSARFLADFTNATVNSRFAFQTSTLNSSTGIYALPNGTSTASSWQASNASDPTNASKILIATNGSTDVQLVSGINGTGTYLPLTFYNNGSEQMRLAVNGNFGIGTNNPLVKLAVNSTDSILIPVGTTAQRPTGATGYLRFNSDTTSFEGYNGTAWGSIGGGATGGGTDQIFYLNGQTVTTSYSIPIGQNAGTFGPVTVNSGATVTIPAGSTWSVV